MQDEIKEGGDSIHHIRIIVRYIRKSPTRLRKFKECIKMKKKSKYLNI